MDGTGGSSAMGSGSGPNVDRTVQFAAVSPPKKGIKLTEVSADTSIPKRWKHAGWPGSIKATRIHYEFDQSAFASTTIITPEKKARKQEVKDFKHQNRLGRRPVWNNSVEPYNRFPDRPLMHTVSEFQSINPVHNYRALAVPDVFHKTVFFPKCNKFQFDRTKLRSPSDKRLVVASNITVNSQFEPLHKTEFGPGWNGSVEIDRQKLAKNLEQSCLSLTKSHNDKLLQSSGRGYVGPRDTITKLNATRREEKLQASALAAQGASNALAFFSEPYTLTKMRQQKLLEEAAACKAEPTPPKSAGSGAGNATDM